MDTSTAIGIAGSAVAGVAVTLVTLWRVFVPRRECALTHRDDEADAETLAETLKGIRADLTPLVTKVAVLETDMGHLTTVVESIAERVGANGFVPRTKRGGQ